jgi:molecular chaperone HtpG
MDVFSSALLRRLKDRDASYYGRIVDLREMVARWLGYVPASFPNYTSHTVEHSDEIIRQVSRVIFRDGDSSKPTVELSALEAYVLCAAAYLHDAGMVVTFSLPRTGKCGRRRVAVPTDSI